MTKEERWRMEGMSFCMRLLDESGGDVEALRKELKRRGALGIPIGVTERQTREFVDGTKKNVLTTVTLLTIAILHDTFGFGSVRVARFIEAFNDAAELLQDDCINWQELQQGIAARLGNVRGITWIGGMPTNLPPEREVNAS